MTSVPHPSDSSLLGNWPTLAVAALGSFLVIMDVTVVAIALPRAAHIVLDTHTRPQHGQSKGENISHEQAMVSRDTAHVTPRRLSSSLRALSAASKSESDRHRQEDGVP